MKKITMWKLASAVLFIAVLISISTGGFKKSASDVVEVGASEDSIIVLSDKRCDSCNDAQIVAQLKQTFPDAEFVELDYNDKKGKALYEEVELSGLPAVLFTEEVKKSEGYPNVEKYLEEKGDYLSLRVGATFDPEAEICDNEKDDDGDKDVDCDDADCEGNWKCMEKSDKPKVEVFVMSHCPFGTQIEKGILPVAEALGDKIDLEIKFCDYAMHGEKEIDEQLNQYCIQKEQNAKFLDYLECFLEEGDGAGCLTETKIDTGKMKNCVDAADKEFKISENFKDKSTWKGNFPTFDVHKEETTKYGVTGSPSLVLNGVKVSSSRDPASLLETICVGFEDRPAECDKTLSSDNPSSGFGFNTQAAGSAGGCGA